MNRELIGKAVALLVSYREYTGDCRIANVCGEIIEALKAELAKPEMPQTDLRKAANMALYALENNLPLIEDYGSKEQLNIQHEAIMALYKTLAQPEHPLDKKADNARELGLDYEPEQEPVTWLTLIQEAQAIVEGKYLFKRFIDGTPLSNDIAVWMTEFALKYTAPKREWHGLTDDEILSLVAFEPHPLMNRTSIVHAVQAKLREKNG